MTLVYITCKDKEEAKKISLHLLKKRLIACSNIFPITSMYWWKGKIENADEHAVLCKTIDKNFEKIKKEVSRMHSYDVPCITMIKSESNEIYDRWVKGEVK